MDHWNNSTSTDNTIEFNEDDYKKILEHLKPPEEKLLGIFVSDMYGTEQGERHYNVDSRNNVFEFYIIITNSTWKKLKKTATPPEYPTIMSHINGIPIYIGDDITREMLGQKLDIFVMSNFQKELVIDMVKMSMIPHRYFTST